MSEFDLKNQKGVLFELVVDLARKALLEDEKPKQQTQSRAPTPTKQPPPEPKITQTPRGKPQPARKRVKLTADGKIAGRSIDFMVLEYLKGRGPCRAKEVAAGIGHPVNPTYMILRRLTNEKRVVRKQIGDAGKRVTTFEEKISHSKNGVIATHAETA